MTNLMKNLILFFLVLSCSFPVLANTGFNTIDAVQRDTTPNPDSLINNIPILSLSATQLETDDGFENISGILSASMDLFTSAAAFNFGAARFRIRGYDNNASQIYINGSSMNDLETGGTYWSMWGGLNDVFRSQNTNIGLAPSEFGFGGLNGATNIDISASSQRKQTRIGFATSNRSYRRRIMAVYTPNLKNDWYLTMSASKRWAKEGYIPGTFYNAYAYFLGVEKKINNHSIAFNALGSPNRRGKSGASVKEMYELAGSNYYNPNWGYHNGDVRNAKVGHAHQPIMILQHKWEINATSSLNTSASYQFGRNGSSAINWNGARDPRPDYYRNLPSFIEDEAVAQQVYDLMKNNEDLRQLNWNELYDTNLATPESTIQNVNGIAGNSITGRNSKYILEERRYDRKKADFNINYNTVLGDNFTVNTGAYYRKQNTHNHKTVLDLLGGDFYLDTDRFADTARDDFETIQHSDLNAINKVVKEGDTFGYSYDSHISNAGGWLQGQLNLNKFDFFIAGNVGQTQFWREGNFRSGYFPESSFGESEKNNFLVYGAKVGATYKINGRNYLFANGAMMANAPSYRDAYYSPRTRHRPIDGLTTEKIKAVEGGYYLKSPYYKARITGYFTQFQDGMDAITFFNDGTGVDAGTFGTIATTGIDKQHFGVEVAAEVQIVTGLSVNAVASIGQYTYTNRPEASFSQDNIENVIPLGTVYQKNFYVSGTPQRAYSAGLKYNSPKFWFANITFNYFDEMYMSFSPLRRTEEGVNQIDPNGEDWDRTIAQEELDNQFTLDLFGGKSWRISYQKSIFLTVGMSNILNNKKFSTGGYEQLRHDQEDLDRFPSKYYYAYGFNYFIQMAFRF